MMKIEIACRNATGNREVVGIPAKYQMSEVLRLIGFQIENGEYDGRVNLEKNIDIWWRYQ